jgi:hypothetical protein
MGELSTVRVLELAIPLLAAVVAWFVNESRKRAWEEYQRKETNYKALLIASRGFYANALDAQKKTDFLQQVDICWLYCPDEVIRRLNGFLDSVQTGAQSTDVDRTHAFAELVLAIRRDLLQRRSTGSTSLSREDYRLFRAN